MTYEMTPARRWDTSSLIGSDQTSGWQWSYDSENGLPWNPATGSATFSRTRYEFGEVQHPTGSEYYPLCFGHYFDRAGSSAKIQKIHFGHVLGIKDPGVSTVHLHQSRSRMICCFDPG
jgi:hypothetical protein